VQKQERGLTEQNKLSNDGWPHAKRSTIINKHVHTVHFHRISQMSALTTITHQILTSSVRFRT